MQYKVHLDETGIKKILADVFQVSFKDVDLIHTSVDVGYGMQETTKPVVEADIFELDNCSLPVYYPAAMDYDLKDYIHAIQTKYNVKGESDGNT